MGYTVFFVTIVIFGALFYLFWKNYQSKQIAKGAFSREEIEQLEKKMKKTQE